MGNLPTWFSRFGETLKTEGKFGASLFAATFSRKKLPGVLTLEPFQTAPP